MAFLNAHRPVHLRPKKLMDITDFKVWFESIEHPKYGRIFSVILHHDMSVSKIKFFRTCRYLKKTFFSKRLILRNILISRKFDRLEIVDFLKISFSRKCSFIEYHFFENVSF